IMTGPLIALGVLTLRGGWFNIPEFAGFLGPVGKLEHWLDPVVGESTKITQSGGALAPNTEYVLVGVANLIAIAGIALAWTRLKPEALVPKREAPPEQGIEKVLEEKYYVDEIYDAAIVQPVVKVSRGLLWRGVDTGLIDGLGVTGTSWLARF